MRYGVITIINKLRKNTFSSVISILFLLFVLLVVYILVNIDFSASSANRHFNVEDFQESPEIIAWIDKCKEDPSNVYALRFRADQYRTNFLIYIPSISKTSSIKIRAPHWFGGSLEIKIKEDSAQTHTNNTYELISVNYSSSKKVAGLKVFINGKAVDCKINESNYAPVSHSWGI